MSVSLFLFFLLSFLTVENQIQRYMSSKEKPSLLSEGGNVDDVARFVRLSIGRMVVVVDNPHR